MTIDNEDLFDNFDDTFDDNTSEDSNDDNNQETDDNTSEDSNDDNTSEVEDEDEDDNEKSGDKKEDDEEDKTKKSKNNRLSRRFRKITGERNKDRETIAKYKEKFGDLEDANGLPLKPNPRRYKDEQSYRDACVTWTADAKNVANVNETTRQTKLSDEKQSFQEKIKVEKANYKDFDEVAKNFVDTMGDAPLTPQLHDAFCNDPNGVDILYYFGKNPHVLEDIYGMSSIEQTKSLSRLSERISSYNNKNKRKKAVSGAPKPVKGKKGNSKKVKNLSTCSMEEFVAQRQKQRK